MRDTARVLPVSPTTVLKELNNRHLTSNPCIKRCERLCPRTRARASSVALTSGPSAAG
jgi:hypothetical protein